MISVAASRADTDGSLLAAALERRRLAHDGGAYSMIIAPDEQRRPGPLSGVPLAVKDLIDVAGAPTRAGSAVFANAAPATRDAAVVAVFRAAGALVTGKTALHELAFGTTGVNAHEGTPANPRDRSRICGGSSSGSAAAVAEGSAALALGTDTGGSVRIPAALCGVVGFKPRFGRLSTAGVLALAPSLDHVGIFAADVRGVAEAFAALSPWRLTAPPPRRIGVDVGALASASPAVARAVERAVEALRGVSVTEVELPDRQLVEAASTSIMFVEAAAQHHERCRSHPGAIGRDVLERLVLGNAVGGTAYVSATAEAAVLRAGLLRLLGGLDAVIGPTVPIVAPLVEAARDDPRLAALLVEHTRLANLTGTPALSLPAPDDGLPVGLQIQGRDDALVLAVAAAIEAAISSQRPQPGES